MGFRFSRMYGESNSCADKLTALGVFNRNRMWWCLVPQSQLFLAIRDCIGLLCKFS